MGAHCVGGFVENVDGAGGAERDQIVRDRKTVNRALARLRQIRHLPVHDQTRALFQVCCMVSVRDCVAFGERTTG